MVFGWGKKKPEKLPVEESPQNKEIPLPNVENVVRELIKLRKSQALSELKILRNNTAPLIEELIKIGRVLEKDNLNVDDIDKHLAIIVVRGKKQVIDVIKKDVSPLPQISSIDDLPVLHSALNQILKKVGDVLGRQTRVIHIFAKKYAAQLKENLEIMNSNHSEISKILKNLESHNDTSQQIISNLTEIENMKKTKSEKSQKILDTIKNIDKLKSQSEKIKNLIEEIKSSDNYKQYLDLKNSFDDFVSQKSRIKHEIDDQFTKISRPLSRYEYASSLDKDQKNILSKLVENPIDVLQPENKDSVIVILENIRKAIVSGSISVKDVEKTLSLLTETEVALDGFVDKVSGYSQKYEKMQSELKSLKPEKLNTLENELHKNLTSIEDLELKSETFQGEIDEIDSKIPQLISEIESKLRQFSNTKYTIVS